MGCGCSAVWLCGESNVWMKLAAEYAFCMYAIGALFVKVRKVFKFGSTGRAQMNKQSFFPELSGVCRRLACLVVRLTFGSKYHETTVAPRSVNLTDGRVKKQHLHAVITGETHCHTYPCARPTARPKFQALCKKATTRSMHCTPHSTRCPPTQSPKSTWPPRRVKENPQPSSSDAQLEAVVPVLGTPLPPPPPLPIPPPIPLPLAPPPTPTPPLTLPLHAKATPPPTPPELVLMSRRSGLWFWIHKVDESIRGGCPTPGPQVSSLSPPGVECAGPPPPPPPPPPPTCWLLCRRGNERRGVRGEGWVRESQRFPRCRLKYSTTWSTQ